VTEFFSQPDDLVRLCANHYWLAVLASLTRLLFSLKQIGNPGKIVTVVSNSNTVFQNLHMHGKTTMGVAAGLQTLALGMAECMCNIVAFPVGFWSELLARLTCDSRFMCMLNHHAHQKADDLGSGMHLGLEVFEVGLRTGVLDIGAPLRGVRQGGTRGAVHGVAALAVGGIIKLTSATLFLISKTTEGIGAKFTSTAAMQNAPSIRMRQPRDLTKHGVLLPYPPLHRIEAVLDKVEERSILRKKNRAGRP